MELIDKEKVVTEIKRRIKEIEEIGTYLSPKGVLTNLLCHLDTIEAKEVDLGRAIDKWIDDAAITHDDCSVTDVINTAKHFFELGLKTKNNNESIHRH